ncbi:metallophosphoesterase family protein [Demequina iriomotensis]|uniref:metallophosphoesterase family protein n=1 Tax=Demequina iriomotensis TaxID=1536641 RepID=UPI00078526D2|nr:metallophosphoesterase [Demequina iriomotensis]
MKVGLLGDIHGNARWARHAIEVFGARGIATVVQVGDLGVAHGGTEIEKWDRANKLLRVHGMTMLVAPGNHEDYDHIDALEPRADGWIPFRDRILLAPRGHRSELGGRSVVWLGGAGSVDRHARRQRGEWQGRRKLWWEQEAISDADIERAVAGGHAEIMVTHEAPAPVPSIERALGGRTPFKAHDREYAAHVRAALTRAVDAIRPAVLVHGHHHRIVRDGWRHPDGGGATRVFGLAAEYSHGGLGVLDTATLEVEHLAFDTM